MPPKKIVRHKKPGIKRRRLYKVMRKATGLQLQPRLSCKRMTYQTVWTFSTAALGGYWQYYTFNATNIGNFAEFANVFDEYKINAVKYTFRPRYDSVDANSATTLPQATMHYFVDQASTVVPTGVYSSATLNTFLENSGVKSRTLNRPVSIYYKPMASDQLTGGSTVSRVFKPGWIKTDNTTISFRGFHAFLQLNNFATANANVQLDIFITFYMSFRNLK